MADIPQPTPPPGPTGAVQPPKKETGKVQPKKETVRINLPPKPTAAPTIKLPTLPPGGPTGAPSAAPALAQAPAAAGKAPATAQQQRPAAPQPQRQASAPAVPTIKGIDKALIYAAGISCLLGVGFLAYVSLLFLKPAIENFQP